MSLRLTTILSALAAACLVSYCPDASSRSLDDDLDCRSTPHSFVASLEAEQLINPDPVRVGADSVNAFRPSQGNELTAFGFRVYAIVGYAEDDSMFRRGHGEAASGPLYGVVVSGSLDAVEDRVHGAGSTATVRQVLPALLTAIVCKES
jgi:hypothetical protein